MSSSSDGAKITCTVLLRNYVGKIQPLCEMDFFPHAPIVLPRVWQKDNTTCNSPWLRPPSRASRVLKTQPLVFCFSPARIGWSRRRVKAARRPRRYGQEPRLLSTPVCLDSGWRHSFATLPRAKSTPFTLLPAQSIFQVRCSRTHDVPRADSPHMLPVQSTPPDVCVSVALRMLWRWLAREGPENLLITLNSNQKRTGLSSLQ
jgi:hypothetical protein